MNGLKYAVLPVDISEVIFLERISLSSSPGCNGLILGLVIRYFFSEVLLHILFQKHLDFSEGTVDLFSSFGSSQNDFARRENKETHFWIIQVVDQSWESLWVEVTEAAMLTIV